MNKTQMVNECRKILYKENITPNDKIFLLELLKTHPEKDLKIGCGVKDFFVKKTIYGNLGFNILRNDGTTTDFSFMKCIYKLTEYANIKIACRNSINQQIKNLKTNKNKVIHHHNISFNDIFIDWLNRNKEIDLRINKTEDNCQETFFINPKTVLSFQKFHEEISDLIEIDIKTHKAIHKGGVD